MVLIKNEYNLLVHELKIICFKIFRNQDLIFFQPSLFALLIELV